MAPFVPSIPIIFRLLFHGESSLEEITQTTGELQLSIRVISLLVLWPISFQKEAGT
jgi:hypothetical protein